MKTNKSKFITWLIFLLCFIGIPAILLYFGIAQTNSSILETHIDVQHEQIWQLYNSLQTFSEGESFWCKYLSIRLSTNTVSKHDPASDILTTVAQIAKQLPINYLVFNKNGIASSSFPLVPIKDWRNVISLFWKNRHGKNTSLTEAEKRSYAKLLGAQVALKQLDKGNKPPYHLTWSNSNLTSPLIWFKNLLEQVIVIFIDPKDIESPKIITTFLEDYSQKSENKFKFALKTKKEDLLFINNLSKFTQKELAFAVEQHKKSNSSRITTDSLIVFPLFLRSDITIFGFIEKTDIFKEAATKNYRELVILYLFYSLLMGFYSFRLIIKAVPDTTPIKWKLRYLFFFANAIPMIVLFFIATDYLNNKRHNLLREKHKELISFLQTFDEKFEAQYAKKAISSTQALGDLTEKLRSNGLTEKVMQAFSDSINEEYSHEVLVASQGSIVGMNSGLYDDETGKYPSKTNRDEKNRAALTRKVGQYFLAKINADKVSEKLETEVELLVESVTMQPLTHFLLELLSKRGKFINWGYGETISPAIIKTISIHDNSKQDYWLIRFFNYQRFQNAFVRDYFVQANRNESQIKLICLSQSDSTYPPEAWDNSTIKDYALNLTSYPSNQLNYMDYQNANHVITGFTGNHLNLFKLIALYPVDEIDRIIKEQRTQVFFLALLSTILSFGLSQFMARSFTHPLRELGLGVSAIKDKNFSYRLPKTNNDEFGQMGEIFNSAMVDLQELSVASGVQKQLLPQDSIDTGNFRLYAKSHPLSQLGGDYYDYFENDEKTHFSALLGDAAGHGVGSALQMAMAKSGIIYLKKLQNNPSKLVSELHRIMYRPQGTKQKRIMTFQYLFANKQSGHIQYSNAGGCYPMHVQKTKGTVKEISLQGAALGSYKSVKYQETTVLMEELDALALYTDGIIEATSPEGEVFGFDRLKKVLLNGWNEDPEQYFKNIYSEYLKHINNTSPADDLTLLILMYNPQK